MVPVGHPRSNCAAGSAAPVKADLLPLDVSHRAYGSRASIFIPRWCRPRTPTALRVTGEMLGRQCRKHHACGRVADVARRRQRVAGAVGPGPSVDAFAEKATCRSATRCGGAWRSRSWGPPGAGRRARRSP